MHCPNQWTKQFCDLFPLFVTPHSVFIDSQCGQQCNYDSIAPFPGKYKYAPSQVGRNCSTFHIFMGFDFLKPGQLQLIELLCTLSKTWGAFHRHISRVHPRYSRIAEIFYEQKHYEISRLKMCFVGRTSMNSIPFMQCIDNFLVIQTQYIYVQALLQLNKNCIYRQI